MLRGGCGRVLAQALGLLLLLLLLHTGLGLGYPRAVGLQSALLLSSSSSSARLLQKGRQLVQRVTRLPSAVQDLVVVGDLKKVIEDGPIPVGERCFMINGWRWHTAAVIRDLERFKSVLQAEMAATSAGGGSGAGRGAGAGAGAPNRGEHERESDEPPPPPTASCSSAERVMGSFNFVVGFSWKGLMRVEAEIFFPWLQKLLPESARTIMADIVQQHAIINALSGKMQQHCASLLTQSGTQQQQQQVEAQLSTFRHIDDLLGQMQTCALRIQSVQESVFVPYISAFVSRQDQEVFNRRVISRLGLLDSQVLLVSMWDAIQGQPKEIKMYEQQIPRLLRVVLPVWRKRLYLPRGARFLE